MGETYTFSTNLVPIQNLNGNVANNFRTTPTRSFQRRRCRPRVRALRLFPRLWTISTRAFGDRMIPLNNHGNAWTNCSSIDLSRTFPTKTLHKKRRFEGNEGRSLQRSKGTASMDVEIKVFSSPFDGVSIKWGWESVDEPK